MIPKEPGVALVDVGDSKCRGGPQAGILVNDMTDITNKDDKTRCNNCHPTTDTLRARTRTHRI